MTDTAPVPPSKWIDRPGVRRFIGTWLIGSYIKFVRATSRVVADPPDFWEAAQKDHWPAIAVSWHGQSNLAYVVMPDPSQVALLISMHPDGMMMGAMAKSIGYQVVEGSGASERQAHGTGGLTAFRNMLKVLKSGSTLFATADIPPEPGRNVSLGMITLARRTGRPMYAIATATSRRKILDRVWDKMQLNFPFSTIAFACEGPFYMNDAEVSDEAYAAQLAASLDRVLAKAFDMADGKIRANGE
ncbi:MAG: lysophospholipid acyltransferase family protein [Devosia sp.]